MAELDLGQLLAIGERAAFHGPPAQAVQALEQAVGVARDSGRTAEATAASWLLGLSLNAAGRYGHALEVLRPLLAPASRTAPRLRPGCSRPWRAPRWAASTASSACTRSPAAWTSAAWR